MILIQIRESDNLPLSSLSILYCYCTFYHDSIYGERSMKIKNSELGSRKILPDTVQSIPCDCERKIVFLMLRRRVLGVPWNRITTRGIRNIKLFFFGWTIISYYHHLKSRLKNVILSRACFIFNRTLVYLHGKLFRINYNEALCYGVLKPSQQFSDINRRRQKLIRRLWNHK